MGAVSPVLARSPPGRRIHSHSGQVIRTDGQPGRSGGSKIPLTPNMPALRYNVREPELPHKSTTVLRRSVGGLSGSRPPAGSAVLTLILCFAKHLNAGERDVDVMPNIGKTSADSKPAGRSARSRETYHPVTTATNMGADDDDSGKDPVRVKTGLRSPLPGIIICWGYRQARCPGQPSTRSAGNSAGGVLENNGT